MLLCALLRLGISAACPSFSYAVFSLEFSLRSFPGRIPCEYLNFFEAASSEFLFSLRILCSFVMDDFRCLVLLVVHVSEGADRGANPRVFQKIRELRAITLALPSDTLGFLLVFLFLPLDELLCMILS